MSHIVERMARLGRLRNAALVAVVVPAALLAGCAVPAPPPPPQPQPVYAPAPPPPYVPAVRG